MKSIEIVIVALVVLGALVYLVKTIKPKGNKSTGCGCGAVDCKVPKPKIGDQ